MESVYYYVTLLKSSFEIGIVCGCLAMYNASAQFSSIQQLSKRWKREKQNVKNPEKNFYNCVSCGKWKFWISPRINFFKYWILKWNVYSIIFLRSINQRIKKIADKIVWKLHQICLFFFFFLQLTIELTRKSAKEIRISWKNDSNSIWSTIFIANKWIV